MKEVVVELTHAERRLLIAAVRPEDRHHDVTRGEFSIAGIPRVVFRVSAARQVDESATSARWLPKVKS